MAIEAARSFPYGTTIGTAYGVPDGIEKWEFLRGWSVLGHHAHHDPHR